MKKFLAYFCAEFRQGLEREVFVTTARELGVSSLEINIMNSSYAEVKRSHMGRER